jgi:hypothetical protein
VPPCLLETALIAVMLPALYLALSLRRTRSSSWALAEASYARICRSSLLIVGGSELFRAMVGLAGSVGVP